MTDEKERNVYAYAEPMLRDMAYFGASEAASYHYPGEDQQLLRDAYCRGAAEYAPKPSDEELTHANIEMARAKSYAKGFQDGLKAARKAIADELNPPLTLTQPDRETGVNKK